ncbi:hypothetical protein QQ045_016956 [Rhodiola kirilowii]
MLFLRLTNSSILRIRDILNIYEQSSGLRVNFEKSELMLSKNTQPDLSRCGAKPAAGSPLFCLKETRLLKKKYILLSMSSGGDSQQEEKVCTGLRRIR